MGRDGDPPEDEGAGVKRWMLLCVVVLGACNTNALRDEPPQTPAPSRTPRIVPGDSKADAKIALEKIASEKFTNLEEIGGELRVVRRSNDHIWACNAWVGTTRALPPDPQRPPPSPGRHFVVATAEMSGEVGGNN